MEPFGFFNIDKPGKLTSHDVVNIIRRGLGIRQVGHAGTLDPLATGVLVVAVGPATRLNEYLLQSDKSYLATMRLGVETDTFDSDGDILAQKPVEDVSIERLESVLMHFRGAVQQFPPAYSALKVRGKPAYSYARAGEKVELAPRNITIYNLAVTDFSLPYIRLRVDCSAGTYIRSLVHDVGQYLSCGGMLTALQRTASGKFDLKDSTPLDVLFQSLEQGNWTEYLIPADYALRDTPGIILEDEDVERVLHGQPVVSQTVPPGDTCLGRAFTASGRFIAVMVYDRDEYVWKPKKVFVSADQNN